MVSSSKPLSQHRCKCFFNMTGGSILTFLSLLFSGSHASGFGPMLDIYLLYIPNRILFGNNFLCKTVNFIDALSIVSQSCCTHTQVTGTLRLVSCAQQSGQFSGIKLDDNEADSQCERRSSLTRSSTDHESGFHKGRTCKKVKPCPYMLTQRPFGPSFSCIVCKVFIQSTSAPNIGDLRFTVNLFIIAARERMARYCTGPCSIEKRRSKGRH